MRALIIVHGADLQRYAAQDAALLLEALEW